MTPGNIQLISSVLFAAQIAAHAEIQTRLLPVSF